MRFVIVTRGSRGDTQPYAALGAGLLARGHDVRLVAPARYRALVESSGLEYVPLSYDPEPLLRLAAGRGELAHIRAQVKHERAAMDRDHAEIADACSGAEAIVFTTGSFAAFHVAEREGAWSCHATLQGPLPAFAGALMWQVFRRRYNRWRREALGLPALPFLGPGRRPTLYGYSPALVPPGHAQPPYGEVTGFWLRDPPKPVVPPGLAEFLGAGPPPVYVGFGAMSFADEDPVRTHALVREALDHAGVRGVVQGDPRSVASDERVHVVAETPHEWLFPQVACVVQHGGSGTTATALRAGAPSVVCPVMADQPFWGRRLAELGAGVGPLPLRRLTPTSLGDAIAAVVADKGMRRRAAELGAVITGEKGVERACDLIETGVAR